MTDRKFHPLADIFPAMEGEPLDVLVADIKEHGLREPITTTEDGLIIDGRNRYFACKIAGIEPSFVIREDDGKLLEWVISKNLARRHLDDRQRADVASKIANMRQGERTDLPTEVGKISRADAAKLLNVTEKSVERASKIHKKGVPELIKAVEAGAVSPTAAANLADKPKRVQRKVLAQGPQAVVEATRGSVKERIGDDPDASQLVESGAVTVGAPRTASSFEAIDAAWRVANPEHRIQFVRKHRERLEFMIGDIKRADKSASATAGVASKQSLSASQKLMVADGAPADLMRQPDDPNQQRCPGCGALYSMVGRVHRCRGDANTAAVS
jgi:hypothetical protein